MQFKETLGAVIVIDCAYVRSEIAEEIVLYESQGYTLRSHAVYELPSKHFTMVSLIFIRNTHP